MIPTRVHQAVWDFFETWAGDADPAAAMISFIRYNARWMGGAPSVLMPALPSTSNPLGTRTREATANDAPNQKGWHQDITYCSHESYNGASTITAKFLSPGALAAHPLRVRTYEVLKRTVLDADDSDQAELQAATGETAAPHRPHTTTASAGGCLPDGGFVKPDPDHRPPTDPGQAPGPPTLPRGLVAWAEASSSTRDSPAFQSGMGNYLPVKARCTETWCVDACSCFLSLHLLVRPGPWAGRACG